MVIRREIQASGKGRATVNGALVPVSLLRDLAPSVAVIHGQHEPQGLLDAATHLAVLDHFAGDDDGSADRGVLSRPARGRGRARAAEEATVARPSAGARCSSTRRRRSSKARSAPGEEESLRVEKARQANAGRLATLSGEAYSLLYDDEDALLGRLGQVYKRVDELASIDPDFRAFAEGKRELLAPLEDLALRLRDYQDRLEVSPGRIDEIESRLALLERLKKKYGASVEDVIAFGERCRRELDALGTPEEQERLLAERHGRLAAAYLERARAVSKKRRAAAGDLRKRSRPSSASSRWRRRASTSPSSRRTPSRGRRPARLDRARPRARRSSCCRRTPGRTCGRSAQIASGGELSRLMLAIKSVIGRDAPGLTLVFDEVDAGIGGRVAEVVGRKLKAVAARRQVLCVTHLPQIAAFADQHLAVRKRSAKGRTITIVDRLTDEAR